VKLLDTILTVLGAVCFLIGALGWTRTYGPADRQRTPNLVSLGLLFWILVPLIALLKS